MLGEAMSRKRTKLYALPASTPCATVEAALNLFRLPAAFDFMARHKVGQHQQSGQPGNHDKLPGQPLRSPGHRVDRRHHLDQAPHVANHPVPLRR